MEPAATGLDAQQVKLIEAALAQHLGPIAAVMVKKAAKSAPSLAALARGLAAEIADDRVRAWFLKKFAGDSRPSQPPSAPGAKGFPSTRA